MLRRTVILAVVLSLGSLASGSAQNRSPQQDQLKLLLQQRFTPQPQPAPEGPAIRRFDWVAPRSVQPGRLNDNSPLDRNDRRRRVAASTAHDERTASDAGGLRFAQSEGSPAPQGAAPQSAASQGAAPQAIAPQAVPAIGYHTYVIVLKENAKADQITSLLQRYNLTITKTVPGLHMLRVERADDDPNASTTASATAPAEGREGLARLLNPKIIQDLRSEPIVDSAFVESTLSPKSVPKAKSTNIIDGGVKYNWHWKDGLGGAADGTPAVAPGKDEPQDGNWGLKVMRLPPVWTIVQRYRAAKPKLPRPKMAILDTGFFPHEDLTFNALRSPDGLSAPNVKVSSSLAGSVCDIAHGNHVAGIAGASWESKVGINGVIPQARIDAVPFTVAYGIDSASPDNADVARAQHLNMFVDIANDLEDYLDDSTQNPDGLHVVSLSLGYNFISGGILEGNPEDIPELSTLIQDEAKQFAHLMKRYENTVLFVVAAGNDSKGRPSPIDAKWASSIAWAATQTPGSARPKNVLIVEAIGRDGQRADFSNVGGHVAAPGVSILSTLSTGDNAYGVCSGTSQAAPYVAGLATLLFELDPTKKPSDIVDIIKSTAVKQTSGAGAPRVDALEAALKLSSSNLTRLADLNADGKVDERDMEIFARQMTELTNNRAKGTPFTEDLNGDGVIDDNECSWPLIDLNGSGTGSLANADAKPLMGDMRTDIQVMQLAWTDKKKKSFDTALHQTGLDAAIKAANGSTATTSGSGRGCR